jgi:hypothetical protein
VLNIFSVYKVSYILITVYILWWGEVGRSRNHLICHVHVAPCSRARAWTIAVPVPMILCILRVATDFTSLAWTHEYGGKGTEQAERKLRTGLRLGGQGLGLSLQTVKWIDLLIARLYGYSTDTIEFAGVFGCCLCFACCH